MKLGVEPRLDVGAAAIFSMFSGWAVIFCIIFFSVLTSERGLLFSGLGPALEIFLLGLIGSFGISFFLLFYLGSAILVSLGLAIIGNFFIPVRRFTWLGFAVLGALAGHLAMMLTVPTCTVFMQDYGETCHPLRGFRWAMFGGLASGLFGYIRHRMLRD